MPLGGSIVPYKSLTCPLCNFELSCTARTEELPTLPELLLQPPRRHEGARRGRLRVLVSCDSLSLFFSLSLLATAILTIRSPLARWTTPTRSCRD